jgi:hypothetical protein
MNISTIIARFRQYPTLFVCGLCSIVIILFIVARGSGLSDARTELQQMEREGARIDENIKNALDLERHLADLGELTEEVSVRLVNPAELARNLQYFYRLESESGVSITDLTQRGTPSPPTEGEAPEYVPVRYDIAVEGNYPNVLEFIYRVESGRHFARFTQMEIVRAQRPDSSAVRLAINLELLGRP